jgi:hypothetical protein
MRGGTLGNEPEGDPKAGKAQQPPAAPIIPEDKAPDCQATTAERDHKAEPPEEKLDRDLVRWTRALAIFTGVLVVASVLQFWVMRGQLDEMKATREGGDKSMVDQLAIMQAQAKAMQHQVEAMKTASAQTERAITATDRLAEEASKSAIESHRLADSATKSAEDSRRLADAAIVSAQTGFAQLEELRKASRAWVVVGPVRMDGPPIIGREKEVTIFYDNAGKEPAQSYAEHTEAFTAFDDKQNGMTLPRIQESVSKCLRTQPPAVGGVVPVEHGTSHNLIIRVIAGLLDRDVVDGDKVLFVYGCMVYRTIDIVRHTAFCYYYQGRTAALPDLNLCGAGNYAD